MSGEARDTVIGKAFARREDDRLLRGAGRYAADVPVEDLLHVVFVRSTMACSRIVDCDIAGALASDDVVAVFTGEDVKHLGRLSVSTLLELGGDPGFPILAHETVSAVGQPIAAVVANSVNNALDASDALFVDIEEDERATSERAAFSGAWRHGDVDVRFAEADHVVEVGIAHPRLAPSPLEPRGITVEYDPAADGVTVWLSTQTPHRARNELATIIGIDKARIRVIAPDVGGAFGMKASLYPEDVLVVWAALKLQRSLRWIATRNEEFLSATHGRGTRTNGQLAVAADGRLLALKASIESPLGHWLPTSSAVPAWNAARILPGGYAVDAVEMTSGASTDDRAAVGIYRGAGRPEAACLMERLIDEAAVALGLDPVEIRLKNLLTPGDLPYRTPTGYRLDSGGYGAALKSLCREVDYDVLKHERDRRRARGELVGLGVAFYVEPCGTGWESARVTLNPDGKVIVATGGSTQGHGRETALAQIAADSLGVEPDAVDVLHGDTASCPEGIGALASRSTAIGGSAVSRACEEIRACLADGGSTDATITREVIYEAGGEAWGYGVYIVTVSIDEDTGVLAIESAACIDDIGTIINPMLVEGQIMGGFAQGVGEAVLEELSYDDYGQLMTGSFMDYTMPRADDIPLLKICKVSTPSPSNLLGAKGVGEAGTIGAPAAILNAAIDALRPLGVRDLQMPLTSAKIWRAINEVSHRSHE